MSGLPVLASPFDLFLPIHELWWALVGQPIHFILNWLLTNLNPNPVADVIGPFGLAIVFLTITIKLILSPVFQYQLSTSRRVQAEQRRIAPQLAAVRKKYKKDPQRLNAETMALYKEHNINPLAQMSGCLPALLQSPILIALFYVIRDHGTLPIHNIHFLWVQRLDWSALQFADKGHHLVTPVYALVLTHPWVLLLPVLAALTTFVQTKMMTPAGGTANQDPTQAAMTQNMTMIMPVFIGFISLQFAAALALYWVVSNLFSIGQQYFITGWGSLSIPTVFRRGAAA